MVKALSAFAVFMAILACPAVADGMKPAMKRFTLPPFSAITIKENGARSPAAGVDTQKCGDFVLSTRDVTEFLRKAGEVSEHDYLHMLDWSPCYASGTARLKDGRTATWGIHRYRGGSIKFSDGQTMYLYCPKCRAKPFQPR